MKLLPIYRKQKIISYSKIDDDDYDRLKDFYWGLNDQGYVIRYYFPNGIHHSRRKAVRQHIQVLNFPNSKIDHINGDRTDNRKCNLRLCTDQQNNQNRTKLNRNSTSGYRGVSKFGNRWRAYVMINRKQISCGIWDTPELASKAAQNKRNELGFFNQSI